MARVKSKKYDGVYINKLQNGDTSYYITYKDENNNLKWFKVGTNKKGDNTFTETYCNTKRNEYINKINLGEDPQAKKKKKDIITFDSIAKKFFDSFLLLHLFVLGQTHENQSVVKSLIYQALNGWANLFLFYIFLLIHLLYYMKNNQHYYLLLLYFHIEIL